MGIFRGTGGTGDSTTDTTVTTVTEKAAEAASSATSAANSATSASNSASSASTSETNAATSETNAATSATNSATSATNSATSATSASTSATTATTKASEASASATNAATSATAAQTAQTAAEAAQTAAETAETNAETAEANTLAIFGNAQDVQDAVDDAEKLAINPEDSQYTLSDGTTTGYSALHHAAKAEDHKTAAEVSKNAAETAETAAETAQGLAETAKTAAETAQSAAETAQAAAELAQSNAETVYDDFDDRYLGTKSGDPLVDNDNEGLTTGTLYFNTTENEMRVYTGTAWVAVVDLGGDVTVNSLTSNNDVVVKGNLEVQGTTITVDSATAQTIDLGDNDKIRFGDGDDLQIYHDGTDSYIANSTGTLKLSGNTDVTGNITVSGTVDGRDVAADGATLDAVASTYVDVSGDTLTGDLAFGDNVKAKFGASDDLQIFHTGTNSIINEVGAGNLVLSTNGTQVRIAHSTNAETMAEFNKNGSALLKYDGANKLETSSSGVNVTGTVTADDEIIVDGASGAQVTIRDTGRNGLQLSQNSTGGGFIDLVDASENLHIRTQSTNNIRIQSSGDISFYEDTGTTEKLTWDASAEELQFKDNVKAEFGDGGDLQIYHSGAASYITEVGTGSLVIGGDVVALKYEDANESYLRCYANDRVDIYYDNAIKLTTTSTGIDVTGTVTADGATINANNPQFHIVETTGSADQNFSIRVSGGNLQFRQANDALNSFTLTQQIKASGDIVFYDDSGSSQDLYWDASTSRLGLGTTTPNGVIHAVSSGVSNFVFQGSDVGEGTLFQIRNGTNNSATGNGHRLEFVHGNNNSRNVFFRTSSTGTFGRSPDLYIGSQNDSGGAELDHVRIRAGGDVSFYNDDSTSQDFYWDASTSRLGLGTTSPSQELTIGSVSSSSASDLGVLGLKSDTNHKAIMIQENSGAEQYEIGVDANGSLNFYNSGSSSPMVTFEDNNDISFYNSDLSAATFRWDSSTSRLGIGTTSPDGLLHISSGTSGDAIVIIEADTDNNDEADVPQLWFKADGDITEGVIRTNDNELQFISNVSVHSGFQWLLGSTNNTGTTDPATGASEVMRIDSSGRLGIGTTAPTGTLQLQDSAASIRLTNDNNTGSAEMLFRTTAGSNRGFVGYNFDSDFMNFRTNGSGEAMRIDSSGRLGLGTSSPLSDIHIAKSAPIIRMQDTDNDSYAMIMYNTASGGLLLRSDHNQATGTTGSNIIFQTDGSEAARIDSSGNLLVGGTNVFPSSNNVVGSALKSNGQGQFSRDGATVLDLNRKTSDGTIVDFRKDGSTVGSIGVDNTDNIFLSGDSSHSGLMAGSNGILPYANGSTTNATEDLGQSGISWRYAYLSGGIRADTLAFSSTSGSEYGRFDSSGRLLVGKTSSGESNDGAEFRSSGFSLFTRNNENVMVINRRNSDGDIVKFKKDGSAVGSILSKGTGTNLAIVLRTEANTDGCGIIGSGVGNGRILPADGNGDSIDNHIDLGTPNTRWQDLYLSGGVYLGGTGSANLLDDYEEGTFTPTFGGSTTDPSGITYDGQTGEYTKIGEIVHARIKLGTDAVTSVGSGTLKIRGLPFAIKNGTGLGMGVPVAYNWGTSLNGFIILLDTTGGTSFALYNNSGYAQTSYLGTGTNANRFWVSFTYATSA